MQLTALDDLSHENIGILINKYSSCYIFYSIAQAVTIIKGLKKTKIIIYYTFKKLNATSPPALFSEGCCRLQYIVLRCTLWTVLHSYRRKCVVSTVECRRTFSLPLSHFQLTGQLRRRINAIPFPRCYIQFIAHVEPIRPILHSPSIC